MYPEASFQGYVASTQDVLLIFEACRRGILPKIHRRLQDKERGIIQSGAIFVFDEHDSGKHIFKYTLKKPPYRKLQEKNNAYEIILILFW